MSLVGVSYYKIGEMNKFWLLSAIEQKLEDKRQIKDRDQIYIEESRSVVC